MPEKMNNRDFIEWFRTTDDTTAINPDHIRKLRELAGISFNVRWDIMCDLASLRVTVREQDEELTEYRENYPKMTQKVIDDTMAIRQQAEEIQRLTEKRETADEKENGFRFGPWRCFQCNAVFTDRTAALAHFGDDSSEVPACSRGHRLIPLERERQLRLENEQQSEEIAAHERSDAEVLRISREALGTPDVHSPQEGAERMARKIAELRICLEPGKASGIVDAVFRIAREKCGRTGYEAHHALTDITRAMDSQVEKIAALWEALDRLVSYSPAPQPLQNTQELHRDTKRLDWLEKQRYGCWGVKPNPMQDGWQMAIETGGNSFGGSSARAAIDTAMAEGQEKP